jgi:alkanesulfonate monooxygenase SsuD/methylene tetrahydromethanopterin reductase-like flavin-dependent oxidoreductase (luciferase family)
MMRVRIFMGGTPATIAEQINDWFENEAGSAQIVKTETAVGPAVDRYGPYPCIVITIWYEPGPD